MNFPVNIAFLSENVAFLRLTAVPTQFNVSIMC